MVGCGRHSERADVVRVWALEARVHPLHLVLLVVYHHPLEHYHLRVAHSTIARVSASRYYWVSGVPNEPIGLISCVRGQLPKNIPV